MKASFPLSIILGSVLYTLAASRAASLLVVENFLSHDNNHFANLVKNDHSTAVSTNQHATVKRSFVEQVLKAVAAANKGTTCSCHSSPIQEEITIQMRTIQTGSTPLHQDRYWDKDHTIVEDIVGFVFLNDNPHATFHHGSDQVSAKQGDLVLFDGSVPHQTIVQQGVVHLLGPFHVHPNMEPVGGGPCSARNVDTCEVYPPLPAENNAACCFWNGRQCVPSNICACDLANSAEECNVLITPGLGCCEFDTNSGSCTEPSRACRRLPRCVDRVNEVECTGLQKADDGPCCSWNSNSMTCSPTEVGCSCANVAVDKCVDVVTPANGASCCIVNEDSNGCIDGTSITCPTCTTPRDEEECLNLPNPLAADGRPADCCIFFEGLCSAGSGSVCPSPAPSNAPSATPSAAPSDDPSAAPSAVPSASPSVSTAPFITPTLSAAPSDSPSNAPSAVPSSNPSVSSPPSAKEVPSAAPTLSAAPSNAPSLAPSSSPSDAPSSSPSVSAAPSEKPSGIPSSRPSATPSTRPSESSEPSIGLDDGPSLNPSSAPSSLPSASPSTTPSIVPSSSPSNSAEPSSFPSVSQVPSGSPVEPSISANPSTSPSVSQEPSRAPTPSPTPAPTNMPTSIATPSPVVGAPAPVPSVNPTPVPTPRPIELQFCTGIQTNVRIEIATDNWNQDSGYEIINISTGDIVRTQGFEEFPYPNFLFEDEICLNPGAYTITIFDEWGDGLCCASGNGFYKIFIGNDRNPRFESSSNNFTAESFQFDIV